jgi:4-hydroxybutyrate dehydrogenase
MIVTDKGVRAAGIVVKVNAALGAQPTAIFDDIPTNPTETAAQAGALLYRNEKCDGLIAIGGGSEVARGAKL